MRRMLWVVLAVAAAVVIVSCGGGGGKDTTGKGEIKIGVFTSKTGDSANWGKATVEGVQLAADEYNAAGGFKGRNVFMQIEDDASKPEQAKTVCDRLVNEIGVCCLLGEVSSGSTEMGAGVAQQAGVPVISSASTRVDLVSIGDCFNRVCFADDFQGAVLARFVITKGWTRIALLIDQKLPYSTGLAEFFRTYAVKHGGQIVATEKYQRGDQLFDAQMTRIRAANPQVIVCTGYHTEVGAIARAERNIGLTIPMLGGDGWDNPDIYKNAGSAIVGDYFSDHFINTDPRPEVKTFVDAYTKKWGHKPEAIAALAYDSARVLFDAMKRADSADPAKLKVAIRQTKNFDGVTGSITIDDQGNSRKPAVIIQIQPNGDFKAVESIPWTDPTK